MLSFIILTARNTVILCGSSAVSVGSDAVEYFGPLNITIPPLPYKTDETGTVYINGTIYSCGGNVDGFTPNKACYKYNLAANSGSWENFTGLIVRSDSQPAVDFDDFFWYINAQIIQVPVNGSNVSTFNWRWGTSGCAVGNGSHTVVIQFLNETVLMNANPLTPRI